MDGEGDLTQKRWAKNSRGLKIIGDQEGRKK